MIKIEILGKMDPEKRPSDVFVHPMYNVVQNVWTFVEI